MHIYTHTHTHTISVIDYFFRYKFLFFHVHNLLKLLLTNPVPIHPFRDVSKLLFNPILIFNKILRAQLGSSHN